MSELIESLEKSVAFLRSRYPAGHALLSSLETQLKTLKAKEGKTSAAISSNETPAE